MIVAVVGSGGKTSLIRELTHKFRREGKSVFVTTTTHMFQEPDTLCTDDADVILDRLRQSGYAMAGVPEGVKIKSLPRDTYDIVCAHADVVLVEADGSKHMALKHPNEREPVIPENVDTILVVCGLHGLGKQAKDCCHRLELVKACLGIQDDTVMTAELIGKLVTQGYLQPLRKKYPEKTITLIPRHDGSAAQQAVADWLVQKAADVLQKH